MFAQRFRSSANACRAFALKILRLFAELQHDEALVYQPYLLSKIENVGMREWIAFHNHYI